MNILLAPNLYRPWLGGVEVGVENLCRQFRDRGHRVGVVTARLPRSLPAKEVIDGCQVRRLPFVLPMANAKSFFTFPVRFLQCWAGLRAAVGVVPWDIVNLHYICDSAYFLKPLCQQRGWPLVASLHGCDVEFPATTSQRLRHLTRQVIKEAAAVTTNSGALRKVTLDLMGSDLTSLPVVTGAGINLKDFDRPLARPAQAPRRYVLAVARLVRKKGMDILIEAWQAVVMKDPEAQLVIIGDGPEREALEKLRGSSGLPGRIHLLGRQPDEVLRAYLQFAEFTVIPSRAEPFGLVALEAMASGKAVVAAPVGGLQEIVRHGENGLLAESVTAGALASAMSVLLGRKRRPSSASAAANLWSATSPGTRLPRDTSRFSPKC